MLIQSVVLSGILAFLIQNFPNLKSSRWFYDCSAVNSGIMHASEEFH